MQTCPAAIAHQSANHEPAEADLCDGHAKAIDIEREQADDRESGAVIDDCEE